MFSNQPFNQLGEKVFYTVTIDTDWDRRVLELELLTGEFNDNNKNELESSLEFMEVPQDTTDAAVEAILSAIELNWDNPIVDDIEGFSIDIERHEETHNFSPTGCDLCNNGLGNNVTPCIGYNDATKWACGEYWEIDVCSDCLYEYHNGERP